jgi:1-acyl-sn-glycerol-3-phosphate acyltransferase
MAYVAIQACIVAFVPFCMLPIALISPRFYRYLMLGARQYVCTVWLVLTHLFAPSTFVLSTDDDALWYKTADGVRDHIHFSERGILMSNHQLYSDWIYLWGTLYTSNVHHALTITLKRSIKFIPVVGWGMQLLSFIFLDRNWQRDSKTIERQLQLAKQRTTEPYLLLVFPEGTTISKGNRAKSVAFANKLGIRDMDHLLLPRATGLYHCVKLLRGNAGFDYIYDLTYGYSGMPADAIPEDYYSLNRTFVQGEYPPKVHVHVRRFLVKDIPTEDEAEFAEWLRARWAEKDALLKGFYQRQKFSDTVVTKPVSTVYGVFELARLYTHAAICVWVIVYLYGLLMN